MRRSIEVSTLDWDPRPIAAIGRSRKGLGWISLRSIAGMRAQQSFDNFKAALTARSLLDV